MRTKVSEKPEEQLKNANSLADLRQAADDPDVRAAIVESLEAPISLLEERIGRLQLKDQPVQVFRAASDEQIDDLWSEMSGVDPSLARFDTTQALV